MPFQKYIFELVFLDLTLIFSLSLLAVYRNKLYIIGGYNGISQNHLNDVHQYDPGKYLIFFYFNGLFYFNWASCKT